jgi:hypothetical protein
MKERVSTRYGTGNVVLVAPHGHELDDSNTGILTMACADALNAHAIINNGWKRAKDVDELRGFANCNNSDHIASPVVRAEFRDPITEAIEMASIDGATKPFVLLIHGVGDSVRAKADDPNLDLIVGYGEGDTPSYTCDDWLRACFMESAAPYSFKVYAGGKGGDYSARSYKNLTQKVCRMGDCNALQLEFVHSLRKDKETAEATGKRLALVVSHILKFSQFTPTKTFPTI